MSRASGDEKDKGGKALALSEVLSARRNAAALFSFQEGEHKAFHDVCLLEEKKYPPLGRKCGLHAQAFSSTKVLRCRTASLFRCTVPSLHFRLFELRLCPLGVQVDERLLYIISVRSLISVIQGPRGIR